jgi:acyl-CoA thioesterase-1
MEAARASWGVASCLCLCVTTIACSGSAREAQPTAADVREPAAAAASTTPAPTASGPKVAFLGDSISAGLHLPADQAFPSVIRDSLAERGTPFQLLNAGVSGDTTAGGLRRIDWLLKQSPAIVVIELGANDGLRGQPVASIDQNLRAIIEKVKASGATPLLLGMRIPPSYGTAYANDFEAVYARVAKDLDVAFVPFFMDGVAGVAELNLPDGLHPTKEGHQKLAKNVEGALAKLLAK